VTARDEARYWLGIAIYAYTLGGSPSDYRHMMFVMGKKLEYV